MESRRPGEHDPVRVLDGHLAFLKMIDPKRFYAFRPARAESAKAR
jgi:hypothetical protein